MRERVKIKPKKVIAHQAIECKFCGHAYLQPCDDVRQKTCSNVKLKKARKKK